MDVDQVDTIVGGRDPGHAGGPPWRARRRGPLAVAVLLLAAALSSGREPTSAPAPTAERGQAAEVPDVYGQPVRGSLAGDRAFLAAVRRLPWDPPPPGPGEVRTPFHPPVDARRVVWAGDVPGGRWVLVVASDVWWETPLPPGSRRVLTGAVIVGWFTGPPGAPADELRLHATPHGVDPALPSALHDPRTGVLLVVGAPGDVVEVSERREISADGQVTRSFQPVATRDGVAVARLGVGGLPYSYAVQYRLRRDGVAGEPTEPTSVVTGELPAGDTLRMAFPRGRPDAAGLETAERVGVTVLAHVGMSRAEAGLTAAWTGSMPGSGAGRAAVVTLAQPSGALLVWGGWSFTTPDGRRIDGPCGSGTFAASAREGTLVVPCTVLHPDVPVEDFLVVVGPRSVTAVRLYARDDSLVHAQVATGGVAVTPWPEGVTAAEAVTDQGISLGRAPLTRSSHPDVVVD